MLASTERPKFSVRHWTPVQSVRQAPIYWVPASFPGGKAAWALRWPFPYSTKVKNEWNYYPPCVPTGRGQGKLPFTWKLSLWGRLWYGYHSLSLPMLRGRCFIWQQTKRECKMFFYPVLPNYRKSVAFWRFPNKNNFKISMVHWWKYIYRGIPKYSENRRKTCPTVILCTIWIDLGSNLGLCPRRSATNRLSHGTALQVEPYL